MVTKILVVDFEEPDLELLIKQKFRKKIQANELDFVFAHNYTDALNLLNKDLAIQIVVTDVNVSRGGGLDLLSHLSTLNRLIKTVVLSPFGDMESIRTAMNLGAFDFITRPINLQDFEITIMKTIEQLNVSHEAEITQSRLLAIEKELDVAKAIQNSIIPHQFKPFQNQDSFDIYGTMIPAKRVGGDFFDFFRISENKLAFTIADVSGKGVPAALFMTMSRGLLRALSQKILSPEHCFQQMNELLCVENESSMFVTAFYGILDIETGMITYCNAGHNPPYLIASNGEFTQIGRMEGIALGIVMDPSLFHEKTIMLKKDEMFLLYTDGVTEAMNKDNELFSEKRLESCIKENYSKPLPAFVDSIVDTVKLFSGEQEQSDDITLCCIRFCGV